MDKDERIKELEKQIEEKDNRITELEFFLAEFMSNAAKSEAAYVRWAVELMENPMTQPPRIPRYTPKSR